MKLIKFLFVAIATTVIFGLGACKEKSQNPAIDYCNAIDKLAAKFEKAETVEAVQNLYAEFAEDNKYLMDHLDYQLTQADKDELIKTMANFLKVSYNKMTEIMGFSGSDEYVYLMTNEFVRHVSKAATLGELLDPTQSQEQGQDNEINSYETIDEAVDSLFAE